MSRPAMRTPLGRLRGAWLVAAKEWRSGVRDKQTLVYTIVLPLALYPTLFWVMLQGFTILQGRDARTDVRVLVTGEVPLEKSALEAGLVLEEGAPLEIEGYRPAVDEAAARAALAADEADLLLAFGAPGEAATLWFDSTESRSSLARERVTERLRDLRLNVRQQAADAAGRDWESLAPLHMEAHDLASERGIGGYILSLVLPMTFVIMAMMGAMVPAIDLTAGEKERGTAETTWLLPVDRKAVLWGKVLAVTGAATVATTLNLLGMSLAAEHLLASLPGAEKVQIEIPWDAMATVAPLALIFLFATSALLVALASLTKTFKQGQSLMGLVQMGFILPGVIAVMPGIELDPTTACVPVVQTVLAFKAALQSTEPGESAPLLLYLVVAVTQLGYAYLALTLSERLTAQESLLSEGAKPRDLLRLLRTARAPR